MLWGLLEHLFAGLNECLPRVSFNHNECIFIPVIYSVTSDSGPSQISVVLDTTSNEVVTREWSMKIYQYECSSPNLAPSGCLQYFTAASGQFQSFNYKTDVRESQGDGPSHLANLNYAVCFRIENGFCGIKYGQVTSDTFSFTISGDSRSVHLNCQKIFVVFIARKHV